MRLKPSEIKPNPDNPRFIKDENFKKLVQSLKDFPEMAEVREVVVNKDHMILGGNMRFKAMQEAGWTEIPVRVVDWTEDKQKQFIIKDNISGGDWDWDVLANEWDSDQLDAWGLELPAKFGVEEVEEDEAPEVSKEPAVSQLGEVYQLGKHRLLCGDATDFGLVSELMNGAQADMVFTDPPYGVDYEGKTNQKLKIQNDVNTNTFAESLPNYIANTKAGAAFYVCCPPGNNFKDFFLPFEEHCYLSSTIIWAKNSLVMGHGDYHYKHEPILYGWNKEGSHKFYGDRSQTTIWEIDRPTASREHPTMKPIALIAKALTNSSKEGDIILDLFSGSGSGLIACEQMNRTFYGAEIDPHYVDVIRKRYAKFTNNNELPDNWAELTPII
jgi:DNA modification methylase